MDSKVNSKSSWADQSRRDWFNTFFLILIPVLALVCSAIYLYTEPWSWKIFALTIFFYFSTGLSITGGYHRLFAHKGYEAHPIIQFFYLFFAAGAFQNSALKWCTDHRVHHLHVDCDDDPYSIKRGFWHAHIGWVCKEGNPKDFSYLQRDLAANPLIRWQHKYFLVTAVFSGMVLPTVIGWMLGSALGGFALAAMTRITLVHHATFFINSLAHCWGRQTYTDRNSAKDSFLLAFLTYGEGYHNFHHLFANDYRNGVRWFHFDPTKWTIKTLAICGFAKKLKTTPQIQILRAKLNMKKKALEAKLNSEDARESVSEQLEQLKLSVENTYMRWGELKESYRSEYLQFKKDKTQAGREKIHELRRDLRLARAEYREAWVLWKQSTASMVKIGSLTVSG